MDLVEAALSGDRRAIARLITGVEHDGDDAPAALVRLFPHTGRAYVLGVTGAPGAGKSTLVNELAKAYRRVGHQVAIVAVDATSPFSGGAILGDRVRMRDLATDPCVFVRSMASRGNLGGLAHTTPDVVKVLDAAGFDTVIVETVGSGQLEVEIAQMAHTVLVVEMPGTGDEIQSIKAGILEIADVFAVNKSDHEGAARTAAILEATLGMGADRPRKSPVPASGTRGRSGLSPGGDGSLAAALTQADPLAPPCPRGGSPRREVPEAGDRGLSRTGDWDYRGRSDRNEPWTGDARWRPRVVMTVAIRGDGVPELVQAIADHRHHLETTGELEQRNRTRLVAEVERIVRRRLMERMATQIDQTRLADVFANVVARRIDPHTAAGQLLSAGVACGSPLFPPRGQGEIDGVAACAPLGLGGDGS